MSDKKNKILANCPACGNELDFLPWDNGSPADEICSCCGIQFGYEDIYADTKDDFRKVYEEWRGQWLASGAKWFDSANPPPKGWNPKTQLQKYLNNKNKVIHIRSTTTPDIKKDN